MSYPTSIRESLAKVEASRARRAQETYPRLSPQERETILRAFHPDYISDAFRQLQVGPNKGDFTPRELADALEAPPLIGAGQWRNLASHGILAYDEILSSA